MRPNATKAKLLQDQAVYGWIIQTPSPSIVELAGLAGLDFVMLDCEHGPITAESLEDLCRAAEVVGVTPLVRVPANHPEAILRALDRGAAGIIVPHIRTAHDAQEAVRAARFAPEGERGFAGYIGARWTIGIQDANPFAFANREVLVSGMVEDKEGWQNLDSILRVPGLDAVHIGPGDLSQSLGYLGKTDHPTVQQAVEDIVTRARRAGKVVGLGGIRPRDLEALRRWHSLGVRFFTLSFAQMAVEAARDLLAQVRGKG
ncbi:MAG: aldolase/citrate lyase family protein [Dehalococcoidia bacterium]|nr:aldolase/citrate lyase family protein [Dehalococcoidia bacterium]MDW8120332.1 aldolase/citrate lyase family protein [Chloroflexota bacterium]